MTTLNNKMGYLYANNGNTTIELVGNLAANVEATSLAYDENADWKGFNLIGNPYPCNAYVDRSFYVLDGNGVRFIPGSGAIPPCTAILVEAQGANESVSFSKTPIRKEGNEQTAQAQQQAQKKRLWANLFQVGSRTLLDFHNKSAKLPLI